MSAARPPEGARTEAAGEGSPVTAARPPEGARAEAAGEGSLVTAARRPFELPGTQVRHLRGYRVGTWMPPGPPPPAGFPALYVLDANALFGTFVEAVRRSSRRPDATGIGPMAIVGIAHDGDELFAEPLRRRDFTLGPPAEESVAGAVGGAPAFLSFIADELAPALRGELPLDAARQALFGHSLAGYFVLEALAARPDAFRTWAAISPSIWWDAQGLRARLAAAALPGSGARVFMGVGEWEDEVPPWQRQHPGYERLVARRAQRRMVGHAQALAAELHGPLGADRLAFRVFPEEDHASVVMVGAQRALRFTCA